MDDYCHRLTCLMKEGWPVISFLSFFGQCRSSESACLLSEWAVVCRSGIGQRPRRVSRTGVDGDGERANLVVGVLSGQAGW